MAAVRQQAYRLGEGSRQQGLDMGIWLPALLLTGFGLVMVGSASIAIAEGMGYSPFHYLLRHSVFICMGCLLALSFRWLGSAHLEQISRPLILLAILMLMLPLVPGLGVEVNGSRRWIQLGPQRFQVVEAVKLLAIIYASGYLAQRAHLLKGGIMITLKPLIFAGLLAAILMAQPDMGSAMVILGIIGGMVWLAGAPWRHLLVLGMTALPLLTFAAMEPYRLTRLKTFLDPWADPFNAGFQLSQALIAVGRGELFGVGLGGSIQKLFYLPEAHTDFIFAVLAEELGLVGVIIVLLLFGMLVSRILLVGVMAHRAGKPFAGYIAYGIGLWLGLQVLISIGVNLGVLPTKGLTLPLISSGGSSLMMTIAAIGLTLRIKYELDSERLAQPQRRVYG
ncbi:MAG: putative lipid II flippase FtsW [Wenzhouxiangellaceae bacterium]